MEQQKPARDRMMERMGHILDTWALPGSEAEMMRELVDLCGLASAWGAEVSLDAALRGLDTGIDKALDAWRAKHGGKV